MTKEEIKKIVRHVFHFYDVNAENRNWTDINEACGEILKALDQESTDENLHREREQAYMQGYEDASKKFRQEAIEICKKHGHYNSAYYISKLPPVTPARKKGKWVAHYDEADDSYTIDCSCCGYTLIRVVNLDFSAEKALDFTKKMTKNYCPNCGTEMESEKNES